MILSLQVPGFHAAAHQMADPSLRGKAVAVAIDSSDRAPLFATNLEARKLGVHMGMRADQAQRRGHGSDPVSVVTPDPQLYRHLHEILVEAALAWSPRLGGRAGYIDIDLGGTEDLWGPHFGSRARPAAPEAQAWSIAKTMLTGLQGTLGITVRVGAGMRRLTARCAARCARTPPHDKRGIVVIAPGHDDDFLNPLPLGWIPDIDRDDLKAFKDCGLTTIADYRNLAPIHAAALVSAETDEHIRQWILGGEHTHIPLHTEPEPHVRGRVRSDDRGFGPRGLQSALSRLSRDIGYRLRSSHLACTRLQIEGTWVDGRTATLSKASRRQLRHDDEIRRFIVEMIKKKERRVRWQRLELVATGLCPGEEQLSLDVTAGSNRLQNARDLIRSRFGKEFVGDGRIPA